MASVKGTTQTGELPVPGFYRADHAGRWDYRPDQQRLFELSAEWRKQHGVRPSGSDRRRVHLLLSSLYFCRSNR